MDSQLPANGYSTRPGAVSVAVNPVALVVQECITVTSAMRKHARWAHSSVSAILGAGARLEVRPKPNSADTTTHDSDGRQRAPSLQDDVGLSSRWGLRGKKGQSMQDNPLLSAFARLRSDLKRCQGKLSSAIPACYVLIPTHRHPQRRCTCDSASIPSSHSIFLDLRTHNFPGSYRYHQVLRIQHH